MRRKARTIIYVCSAVRDNTLLSKMIDSTTVEDACVLFEKEYGIKPQIMYGPFYKKKTGTLDKNFDIKFKIGQSNQGIYNGWHVTVMPLTSPPDSAYLLYNKRVDGQKAQKPHAVVAKLKEIQELK